VEYQPGPVGSAVFPWKHHKIMRNLISSSEEFADRIITGVLTGPLSCSHFLIFDTICIPLSTGDSDSIMIKSMGLLDKISNAPLPFDASRIEMA